MSSACRTLALVIALTVDYVAWLGWRRDGDPQWFEVLGALAGAVVLSTVAAVSSDRPRRTSMWVFWLLLALNSFDMGLRTGENLWLASVLMFGPFVWLAIWLPAVFVEARRPPRPVLHGPWPEPPVPTVDEQVAAWRDYRRRTG